MDKEFPLSPKSDENEYSLAVRIKQEPVDDIKDYAEKTMNDLLGLYGYDGVDSSDTHDLNLARYTSASRISSADDANKDDVSLDSTDNSSTGIGGDTGRSSVGSSSGETSLAAQHRNLVSALTQKHNLTGAHEGSLPSGCRVSCAWCQKPGAKLFPLTTGNEVKAFCSESCFSLCRRASFKKSKICEWCKHVRHTVNYVDFQDGDQQLQFCSEKCLNQFKMHLFCKETSEHLPKIQAKCDSDNGSTEREKQILITPELWLSAKNERNNNEKKSVRERHDDDIHDRDEKYDIAMKYEHKPDTMKRPGHSGSFERHSMAEKNVNERTIKDRHQKLSREKSSSQTHKSDSQNISPSRRENSIPPHYAMNSTMFPSMSQWYSQGQYMNPFMPGMPPYGTVPPMFYGFLAPPYPGAMLPNFQQADRNCGGRLLSPMSDQRSASSTPVGPRITTPGPSITPGTSGPRKPVAGAGTSGQQRFYGDGNPSPMNPAYHSMFPGQFPPNLGLSSGIPPVTVMVPFPIPLPIPIPIPIPIPLEMEQMKKLFKKSQETHGSEHTNGHDKTEHKSNELGSKHCLPPQCSTRSCKSEKGHVDTSNNGCSRYSYQENRSCSRNSCPDLYQQDRCRSISSHSDSALKRARSRSPDEDIFSKRPRSDFRYDNFLEEESASEKAIDLSKDSGLDSEKDCSYMGKDNLREPGEIEKDSKRNAIEAIRQPRIHIVPTRHEPPLSQQLPLPPAESTYNFRRGLILDNPNVPKKTRSPSPERRYVRSHPQDLIESVRRRHMRSRIRTK